MLKKTITYTNPFTNEEVTEDHHFHLSKADMIEMQASRPGGMESHLQTIIESNDNKVIVEEFKAILKRAYGKKVGDRFVKSDEIWNEFVSSEAYSTLFFELFTDASAAAEFMNGIIPGDLDAAIAKIQANEGINGSTPTVLEDAAANLVGPRLLTPAEVAEMDAAELKAGLAENRYKLS